MAEQPSITCPRCGRTSYHPEDIRWGYCGSCHSYTGGERTESTDTAEASYVEEKGP
jgi:ribosomal protein L37E